MAIELLMPKIGLTMTEGKVVEWKKRPGQRVEKGEVVFVFETEKASYDVEAPAAGFLARVVADVEDTVEVGAVVGWLVEREGEALPEATDPLPAASPALAPAAAGGRLVPLSPMRRRIAERLLASRREAAQTEMAASVDASALLAARERLGAAVQAEAGAALTFTDLVLRVTAAALAHHAELNSRWTEKGILLLDALHLGLAVALEDGLVVPVLRDAGRLSLAGITRARAGLVERGRAGRLAPDEIEGSSFTVSSLGMLGVEEFTAILNPPETAILAVGAVLDRAVVVDRQVVARPVMKVTLSYDHRAVDGAAAARFLATFRALAENPSAALGQG